jgi:CheY-like chemotaxis protein
MKATPCDCLERVRTFRCPNCAACFCRQDASFKNDFWSKAPRELQARAKEVRGGTEPSEYAQPADMKRPLVLFADDDAAGRAIASRVMTSAGYGVIVAKDGEEALKLALEYLPDLVITDAFMPRIDGRELARRLKIELPSAKIIVISGVYKDARYKYEALRDFQVDDYLTKPVSPGDLRDVLARHLPIPK